MFIGWCNVGKTSKVYNISDDEFRKLIGSVYSYSDALRTLGLNTSGGSSTDILKQRISELNCSVQHFYKSNRSAYSPKQDLSKILIENSTYHNISCLKKRLITEGVLEYKCAKCGNTGEWMNEKLVLELDHIDGVNNNHTISNLRFLCPNCHAQTKTYKGKNI